MHRSHPPKLARALLRFFLRGEERDVIIGDLDEEHSTDIRPDRGVLLAALWYWKHAVASVMAVRRRDNERLGRRSTRGQAIIAETWQDLRYAGRGVRKDPAFALVAIFTLALGIGATTAIFTVVHAVMLRPLPYHEPDRLVLLWNHTTTGGLAKMPIAAPDVAEYEAEATLFEAFAFSDRIRDVAITGDGDPQHVTLGWVSANFFDVLGIDPHIGRRFLPGEGIIPPEILNDSTATPEPNSVILSYGLWQRFFGADASVIGRAIEISGQATTVVGVLQRDFELLLPSGAGFSTTIDVWSPLRFELSAFRRPTRLRDRDSDNTGAVIGRLNPGVTVSQAQLEMDGIAHRQRERFASYDVAGMRIDVGLMHNEVVGQARPILLALAGAVSLVLLIACINVANLVLARANDRDKEMALRAALGASRGRRVRQVFTESAVLSTLGGVAGVLLAWGGVRLLVSFRPEGLPRLEDLAVNAVVLGFSLGMTLLATMLFGIAPAFDATRRRGSHLLHRHGGSTRHENRFRNLLIIAEVSLSLTLLVGAGLSFERLQRVQPGFVSDGVLAFDLTLRYPNRFRGPGERSQFVNLLQERIAALPTVQAVGLVGRLPLGGRQWTQPYGFAVQTPDEWGANRANFRVVTAGYFSAMGTRLLTGRHFLPDDDRQDLRVVIVDETLARRIEANGPVIGSRLSFPLDGAAVSAAVIGVVENVRHHDLRSPGRETLYVPYRHEASREVSFVVRTSGDPTSLIPSVRQYVRGLEAGIPLYNIQTMNDYVAAAIGPTQFALTLMLLFAGVALFLAAVGLYGVISYSARRRTHEIGIRMALGAERGSVVRQVVWNGMTLVGIGLGIGIAMSLAGSRLLTSTLFETRPTDPATYAAVTALLAAVSLFACYLPARRASSVDPMESLRQD